MLIAVVQSWIGQISLGIAFIYSLWIIRRNHLNKTQLGEQMPKYLNLWASLTLYSTPCCIVCFFARKMPVICEYLSPLAAVTIVIPHFFFLYFEISRLKLCFERHVAKSLAYPNCLFAALYAFGILPLVISATYLFKVDIEILPHGAGCILQKNHIFRVMTLIFTVLMELWSLAVLLLYIYKIYQCRSIIHGGRESQNTPNHIRRAMQRIDFTLRKIVSLIVIMQCVTMLDVLLSVLFSGDWQIGWTLEFVLVITAMYLMLQHNEKDYNRLLATCCCGRCSNYTHLMMQTNGTDHDEQDGRVVANDTELETDDDDGQRNARQEETMTMTNITVGSRITTMSNEIIGVMQEEMSFIDTDTISNDVTLTVPHAENDSNTAGCCENS